MAGGAVGSPHHEAAGDDARRLQLAERRHRHALLITNTHGTARRRGRLVFARALADGGTQTALSCTDKPRGTVSHDDEHACQRSISSIDPMKEQRRCWQPPRGEELIGTDEVDDAAAR